MSIDNFHLLIDFALCVVLWLVQLVIYPSFRWIQKEALTDWHSTYTFRVSFVIIPLMLTQLILSIVTVVSPSRQPIDGMILALVIIAWILTFFVSVPLHRKIEEGRDTERAISELINTNWPRTIVWSLIFAAALLR